MHLELSIGPFTFVASLISGPPEEEAAEEEAAEEDDDRPHASRMPSTGALVEPNFGFVPTADPALGYREHY